MAIQPKDRRAVGVKFCPKASKSTASGILRRSPNCTKNLLSETEEKTTTANFLVGEIEGAFLKMLVRMTQAKSILEVGMFTGYSALSFCRGITRGWLDHHLRARSACYRNCRRFFAQSPHREQDRNQSRAGPPTL